MALQEANSEQQDMNRKEQEYFIVYGFPMNFLRARDWRSTIMPDPVIGLLEATHFCFLALFQFQ